VVVLGRYRLVLDKPHSKFRHVYAVVRIDIPFNENCPGNSMSVVKVTRSKETAETEVSRMNQSTLTRTASTSVVSRGSSTRRVRGSGRGASAAVELRCREAQSSFTMTTPRGGRQTSFPS